MVRFGLVSFPVEAFNAYSQEESQVHFHQLHAECHRRIHYQTTCPIHGPVPNDEIVNGSEYSKGQYVEIDPDELDKLQSQEQRTLTIDTFISPDELDLIYFDGRMYYLSADGNQAREPYAVFVEALQKENRWGVRGHSGRFALSLQLFGPGSHVVRQNDRRKGAGCRRFRRPATRVENGQVIL